MAGMFERCLDVVEHAGDCFLCAGKAGNSCSFLTRAETTNTLETRITLFCPVATVWRTCFWFGRLRKLPVARQGGLMLLPYLYAFPPDLRTFFGLAGLPLRPLSPPLSGTTTSGQNITDMRDGGLCTVTRRAHVEDVVICLTGKQQQLNCDWNSIVQWSHLLVSWHKRP